MENNKYWLQLSNEYLEFVKDDSDKNIQKWYEQWKIKNKRLNKKYGHISWVLQDLAYMLEREEISAGKFRELVRFCLDKELKEYS